MTPAEQFQATRASRKLTEALKLLSTAKSCLGLMQPDSKKALGVERDEAALIAVAGQLHEMRLRLGFVRPDQGTRAAAAAPAPIPAPPLTPRPPADPTFKPAVVVRPPAPGAGSPYFPQRKP